MVRQLLGINPKSLQNVINGYSIKSAKESAQIFRKAEESEEQLLNHMSASLLKGSEYERFNSQETMLSYLKTRLDNYIERFGSVERFNSIFRRVDKKVIINGKETKIKYEGLNYDITADGIMLKKTYTNNGLQYDSDVMLNQMYKQSVEREMQPSLYKRKRDDSDFALVKIG